MDNTLRALRSGGTGNSGSSSSISISTTRDSTSSASTPTLENRANGHVNALHRDSYPNPTLDTFPTPLQLIPPQYLPNGRKSLPGISIRSFLLGMTFGVCSVSAVQMAYLGYGLWRVPFFISTLSAFHYLEFDMTARFNPPDGGIGSFLLFNNGWAYTIAHTLAVLEILIRYFLFSRFKPSWMRMPFGLGLAGVFQLIPSRASVVVGIALIVLGQAMRSLAMAHAKTNFNHVVQSTKKSDHVLVTQGVYSISRHPSYFGFFWWGLGTQILLGNLLCFAFYATVLWTFFSRRIYHEEKHLVEFFGQNYLAYRRRVGVWIPFIR